MKIKFISALEKVFPHQEPNNTVLENYVYCGETLSFQFCYQSERTAEVYIEADSDISEHIELHKPKLIPALVNEFINSYMDEKEDDYVIFKQNSATYYPDKLENLPAKLCIVANWWNSVWITVKANAPIGKHALTMRIKSVEDDSVIGEATQAFTVLATRLEKCDIPITCWYYYDCLADAHNLEAFSDAYFDMLENYFRDTIQKGINTSFVPLFSHPKQKKDSITPKVTQIIKIERENGKYKFDFSLMDKFIKLAQKYGFEYFEFSHIASQKEVSHCPKIVGIVDGKEQTLFDSDTDCLSHEYIEFLTLLFEQLRKRLIEKGIYEKCLFHISDEPQLCFKERYMFLVKKMREILPNATFIDALHPLEFSEGGLITPVASTQKADGFIKNNVEHWVYYCCEEMFNNLSNRFFNHPLLRTRIIGTQLYLNGAKGFLHWSLNSWYASNTLELIDPDYVANGNGGLPSGDCFLIYPGENAPISSVRMEAFSDAIRDYKTLKTLEKIRQSFRYVFA